MISKNRYIARSFVGLLIGMGLFASPPIRWKKQTEKTMDSVDQRVTEKFAEFEKKQDPTAVFEALDSIEAAVRDVPPGDVAARRRAVSRWLSFFALLDRNIDPSWNPNDAPPKGVPPPSTHGAVQSSGEVDPSTIQDPAVRAQYERALKANKEAHKRYYAQLQLRRIDDRAMRMVERLLAERYTNAAGDRQDFEGLLAASPVKEPRKERLRTLMPKPESGDGAKH